MPNNSIQYPTTIFFPLKKLITAIPDTEVKQHQTRVRLHDFSFNEKKQQFSICFVNENLHYVTYLGHPEHGVWTPVVESSFTISHQALNMVCQRVETKGLQFVLETANLLATKS